MKPVTQVYIVDIVVYRYIVDKKNKLNLLFMLVSYLNSNFTLTLGYLNTALNNLILETN